MALSSQQSPLKSLHVSFLFSFQQAMAFCGVGVPSSNHHYLLSPTTSTTPSRKPTPSLPPSLSSTATSSSCVAQWRERLPPTMGRRTISTSFVGLVLSRFLFMSKAVAEPALELDRYTDPKEGFSLLVPSSWTKVPSFFLFLKDHILSAIFSKWVFSLHFICSSCMYAR